MYIIVNVNLYQFKITSYNELLIMLTLSLSYNNICVDELIFSYFIHNNLIYVLYIFRFLFCVNLNQIPISTYTKLHAYIFI